MYFHNYDTSYDPSIPMIELGIGLKRGQSMIQVPALVDSGADATLIPLRFLKQIKTVPNGTQWLRTGMGDRYEVKTYPLFLQIGSYTVYASVLGDPVGNEATVGRDVMNHFVVTLDALGSVVQFTQ